MNTQLFGGLLAAIILVFTTSVKAHDPAEHAGTQLIPDCTTMPEPDDDRMDKNDPVAQAMMKQCMSAMHHDDTTTERTTMEKPGASELLPKSGPSLNHEGG